MCMHCLHVCLKREEAGIMGWVVLWVVVTSQLLVELPSQTDVL